MAILEVEQHERVRRLRLNRPEKLNALSSGAAPHDSRRVAAAMNDDETAVVVLCGAGQHVQRRART